MKVRHCVLNSELTCERVFHAARLCRDAALALTMLLAFTPLKAPGLGSRIPNQDATAIGRGNAFVATADNPSAMYYNPAGIAQLEGQHAQVGSLFYLNIYADYDSPSGERTKNKTSVIPVPQLGYTITLKDLPLSFGLGVYAPFGLGMEWPDSAPFRNAGLQAKLNYITVNPVVAWKPISTLAIAMGPTFNYSDAKLRQGVAVSPYQFHFTGDDFAYGFNAGIMWQPLPQWSFGAKYMSSTEMDYEGTASFKPAAPFLPGSSHTTTHLNFPQIASGGVSFRPTTNWNFEVDVDWTDWDTVQTAVIKGIATLPLHWHSSFFYEVGVTRQLGKGYFVSAGYFFSEASTSDKFYTPLVPDTDLHVGSLGVGRVGEKWSWSLAGQIIGGPFRKIDNAADPTVNGSWRLFTPTVSFSVGYRF
jgi:long-chain fatty acid transport protein